jgi:hypothetical protein
MPDIPGNYNCFSTISQADGHLIVEEKITVESMQAVSADGNVISVTSTMNPTTSVPQVNGNDVYIYKDPTAGTLSIYYGGTNTTGQSLGDGTNITDPTLQQPIADLLTLFSDLF